MFTGPGLQQDQQSLHIARSARLLTPEAAGAALLWQAVQKQASLKASPMSAEPLHTRPESPQQIYCESSGSTGAAKLIRRSPASWQASFEVNRAHFDLGPEDRYAVLGHLGHSLSLYAALEALHIGAGLAVMSDLRPRQQAAALRRHRITTIYATPSQLHQITRADPAPFPHVARLLFGGGRPDPGLRATLSQRFPAARRVEFFGASETSFISLSDDQTPRGSVGRPYPGVALRIGEGVPCGEVGEIWVKSPYLFEGYAAGESPLTRWQGGAVSIGELGWLDDAGYLFLQGRLSRMVTVADQNVYPEAIEAVLMAQPGVEAVAVLTPDDTLRGAVIVAAVVGNAEAGALRKACAAELGPAAVPRRIWRLSELPMLPAGKPDLQRLGALWQEDQSR